MSKPPKRPVKEEFINTMHCSSMETWNTGDFNKKPSEWEQYNVACQQIGPVFNNLSNYPIFIPGQPNTSLSPHIKAPYTYGDYKRLRSEGSFTGNNELASPNHFEISKIPQHFYYQLEVQRLQLQKQGEAIRQLQIQNEILMKKIDKGNISNSVADIQPPSPAPAIEESRHDDQIKYDNYKNDQRFKTNDYDRNTWKSDRGRERDGSRNRYYGSNRGRNYNNNYSYNRRDRDNNFSNSRRFNTSPQLQNNYNSNQNTVEDDWDAELADSSKSIVTEQKKVQAKMIFKACQEASQSVEDSWDHIDITKPAPTRKQSTFNNKITAQTNDEEENWDSIDITAPVLESENPKSNTETKINDEENWANNNCIESESKTLVDPKSEEENWEIIDSVTIKMEEVSSNENPQNTDNSNEEDLIIQQSDWNQMKNLPPLTEDQFVALLNENDTKEIEITVQNMKQDEEETAEVKLPEEISDETKTWN